MLSTASGVLGRGRVGERRLVGEVVVPSTVSGMWGRRAAARAAWPVRKPMGDMAGKGLFWDGPGTCVAPIAEILGKMCGNGMVSGERVGRLGLCIVAVGL